MVYKRLEGFVPSIHQVCLDDGTVIGYLGRECDLVDAGILLLVDPVPVSRTEWVFSQLSIPKLYASSFEELVDFVAVTYA